MFIPSLLASFIKSCLTMRWALALEPPPYRTAAGRRGTYAITSKATCFTWRDIRKWSLTTVSYNGTVVRQVHVCSTSIAFPISVLQAKLFFFAVTKNRIGHGPRCRHSRSRRAIHRCSNDGAASIPKSGPEIKNRCTLEGVNGEKLASIPKSWLEIKNRCTKEDVNRQNPASIRKSGPEIRNRCSNKAFSGHSLQRFPNSPPKIKNHCTDRAKTRAIPAAIAKFTP